MIEFDAFEMEVPGGEKVVYFVFYHSQRATKVARNIYDVHRAGAIALRTVQFGLFNFKNCDFNTDDAPWSGQPYDFNKDCLKMFLKKDGRQTRQEVAEKMIYAFKTIANHFIPWT